MSLPTVPPLPPTPVTLGHPAPQYRRLATAPAEPGTGEAWHSPALRDEAWDDFLRRAVGGQFQQSSMWAEYKEAEGWNHHRIVLTGAADIVGGFQILWKNARLGRIGYVSKGPVAHPDNRDTALRLKRLLVDAARDLGLLALVAQDPDNSRPAPGVDESLGLVVSNPMRIVDTTYLLDVGGDLDAVRRKMTASMRRNIRLARRHGLVVREGTESDIPRFFELMAATCRRQNTEPNPGSVEAVRRLWRAFSPSGSIRITFAERDGAAPAAKLSLAFGDTMTVWKKGWDGTLGADHPNELLEDDAFEWAHGHGYRVCDFGSMSRAAARQILRGQPVDPASLSSRDEYHLRFGGYPKILPPALVYLPRPTLRWIYRQGFMRVGRFRNQLEADAPSA